MKPIPHPAGDQHWTRREPDRVLRGCQAPGARLAVRLQDGITTLTISRSKKPLGATDHEIWQLIGRIVFGALLIIFAVITWIERRRK